MMRLEPVCSATETSHYILDPHSIYNNLVDSLFFAIDSRGFCLRFYGEFLVTRHVISLNETFVLFC